MKKLLSFALILAMCFLLSSCGVKYENYTVAAAAKRVEVDLTDSRDEGYLAFISKLDRFAAKLTYQVYSDSDKQTNVCISPVSVYMALALAAECADGETREEILNAVGVTYDEVSSFTQTLYSFANQSYTYSDALGGRSVSAFEELANSIWADNGVKLKEEGVNNLANNYNCDLFSVDFGTTEGEKAINAYIKEKTHGIIDSDIDLSPETLITLINTFYLKEVWNENGNKLKFTDESYGFKNSDGSITDTELLCGYYFNGKAYEGDGFTTFFTETEHGFRVKFIVPADGHTLEEVFTSENIYTINNITDYGYQDDVNMLLHHTRVLFPEYKASYDGDIADILKEDFGINKLFELDECDFSNITDEPVACDGVIHKCGLTVNARGIEGAAVTVMPMNGAAGPLEGYEKVYHDYVVDRAFGFVITDRYGSLLFSGAVNDV